MKPSQSPSLSDVSAISESKSPKKEKIEYQGIHYCDPQEVDVGAGLRKLREEKGHSLRHLAEISGLAANTLSLIENGKSSPSVKTLQKLAQALGVPLTAFFESGAPRKRIAHVRADDRTSIRMETGMLEDLGTSVTECNIEPYLLTLYPYAISEPPASVHTGHEFIFCLEGSLEYIVDNNKYLLEMGDSLFFEAHLPHRWLNPGNQITKAILMLCPDDERERPGQRHFRSAQPLLSG